jgi:hypothetical protein
VRKRLAVKAFIATLTVALAGSGIAYAATIAAAPTNGTQLTGTVYVCVQTTNESHQYVELGNPQPGNCHAGYLQYTVNASSVVTTTPEVLTNSEAFAATQNSVNKHGCNTDMPSAVCVSLPTGDVITGSVTATDLGASAADPDTVTATVSTTGAQTGEVVLSYSDASGHPLGSVEVTYEYES